MGTGAISDLQRLTVSLRGGCERQAQCLLFSFTGQLDAYSDKQFSEFIGCFAQVIKVGATKLIGGPAVTEEPIATKKNIGWDENKSFFVPEKVYELFNRRDAK